MIHINCKERKAVPCNLKLSRAEILQQRVYNLYQTLSNEPDEVGTLLTNLTPLLNYLLQTAQTIQDPGVASLSLQSVNFGASLMGLGDKGL
jgi:hypothetical protein